MNNDCYKWQNVLSLGKNSSDKPDMPQKPQSLGNPMLVHYPASTYGDFTCSDFISVNTPKKNQHFVFDAIVSAV